MSDNDTEVERIMTGRPPSSYGSMCSDGQEEDDDETQDNDAPQPIVTVNLQTRIKLRPDSPETAISSVTQDRRTSVHNEGVYINVQKKEQDQEEVMMEVEDNERNDIQTEPSSPESTASLTPAADEFSLRYIFTAMLESLRTLSALELGCFVRTLYSVCEGQLDFRQLEQEGVVDVLGVVDRMLEKWGKGDALNITTRTLFNMNKRDIANKLTKNCAKVYVQFELRMNHKRRYYSLYEGVCRPGQQRYIRHVYVESPIVLETPNDMGATICTRELFSTREGEGRVRVVVTTGIPAIGHTVTTQMFIMDWSEEKAHQDFHFVFPLPGRDLHLVREADHTFLEFLTTFYPEAKHADFLACPDSAALFIIDALELCVLPLDFQNNPSITDITTPAPVDALMTSLIKGDLLPHAYVWITTRRSTCSKIPAGCISRFTELKGFTDSQKDEYFTKRTKDPSLGRRVLDHIKNVPDLYEPCYLPLFSWIVSFGYERSLQNPEFPVPVPLFTTLYAQYIIALTNRKIERYVGTRLDSSKWKDADKAFLMKMGQLAFMMLKDGRSVFYENDVSIFALDINDITHRGGISSETYYPVRKNGRNFRFIHHTIQTFMAAMYVYVKFRTTGENVFESQSSKNKADRRVIELYKPLIDRVLSCHDRSMDLFLRFVFGLATHETEVHLRGHLLPQYHPEPKGIEDVAKHARKKIKENAAPERCRNLQVCLTELEEGRKTNR